MSDRPPSGFRDATVVLLTHWEQLGRCGVLI